MEIQRLLNYHCYYSRELDSILQGGIMRRFAIFLVLIVLIGLSAAVLLLTERSESHKDLSSSDSIQQTLLDDFKDSSTFNQADAVKLAPFLPTPMCVVDKMLELAEVDEDDMVYDLGCGDGRIVIAAARDFGARGIGIDIDPRRIEESEENARKAGVSSRVLFREEDLFEADFSDATVVTLFLWPSLNLKLRPILMQQLKSGTRIVSYIHNMGDWTPEKEMTVNAKRIYLWAISDRK